MGPPGLKGFEGVQDTSTSVAPEAELFANTTTGCVSSLNEAWRGSTNRHESGSVASVLNVLKKSISAVPACGALTCAIFAVRQERGVGACCALANHGVSAEVLDCGKVPYGNQALRMLIRSPISIGESSINGEGGGVGNCPLTDLIWFDYWTRFATSKTLPFFLLSLLYVQLRGETCTNAVCKLRYVHSSRPSHSSQSFEHFWQVFP